MTTPPGPPPPPPPPPSGWGLGPGGPPPPATPSPEERNWALASHIGCLLSAWVALAFLAPLLVMLLKGKESGFVRSHAVESLNFQLSMLIYGFVGFLLIFVGIGILVVPVLAVLWLVFVVIATLRASEGRLYRYPMTIRFVS